ncbi:MAG: hypothetical protein O7A09_00540 [Proteobacteria bacterium]|nr:hypothetical protein [Pseudomonadota bacterium]
MSPRFRTASLVLALLLLSWSPAADADPLSCLRDRLRAAGSLTRGLLKCHSLAASSGTPVDAACLDTRLSAYDDAVDAADQAHQCFELLIPSAARDDALRVTDELVRTIVTTPDEANACAAGKLKAARRRVSRLLKIHALIVIDGDAAPIEAKIEAADQLFAADFAQAKQIGECGGGRRATRDFVDTFVDYVGSSENVMGLETVLVPSVQAPGTPGTPGVDANDYPKLVTQYGGSEFSLNNAVYTRVFYQPGQPPAAVLILVPGFEGGALSLKIMAENLVMRFYETGMRLEVWLIDRRGHQLEDREGMDIAEDTLDPLIAMDWLFGETLGLELHANLVAGPNRRALFHGPQAETAFMANWTSLVLSRDIDAVVDAARTWAVNQNVFLGGHSAGTGFTARYAATDFDLSGDGPPQPGYTKLRGLVLLEGGGSSSAGDPPSEDTLDRIEDRADGGMFFAVRDDAPRCADGTACTVETEDEDCAGVGRGTCTEPSTAYAIFGFGGLPFLNPQLLAASGIPAIQAVTDPNEGLIILFEPQGGDPLNYAVQQVPELAAFSFIPPGTVAGFAGTFLDDDSPFAPVLPSFLQTSIGYPGPVVDGLATWQAITEGPLPPAAFLDKGPPPTELPAGVWGVGAEVVRIDRLLTTFFVGESNFTDWYYPNAGPSTTTGLVGLDSTPLSVGRGRRDIENLTQAGNIDIPVIAFGGSNGLTTVPGNFVPFAQSLAPCAAPSCNGTPRVIDADQPNPAFPTLGGVEGGFQVKISEGLAHVDVAALEDDRQSKLYKPLVRFLQRNLQ